VIASVFLDTGMVGRADFNRFWLSVNQFFD